MLTLGARVRAARKEAGLTQQALAGSEFSPGFISQLENDLVRPSLRSLELLAGRLGKPLGYFLEQDAAPADLRSLDLAEQLLEAGHLAEAAPFLEPVAAHLDRLQQGRFRALRLLGVLRLGSGDPGGGLALLEQAVALAAGEPPVEQARLHNAFASAYDRLGRWQEALHHLEQALALLGNGSEAAPLLRLKAETNYAIVLCRLERYEECKAVATALLEEAGETRFQYRLGELLQTMGVAHRHTGDVERALQCYALAEGLYTLFGDRRLLAGVLGNAGLALVQLGRCAEAGEAFRRAAALFREMGDRERLVSTTLEHARCARAAGDLDQVEQLAAAALDLGNSPADQAEARELLAEVWQTRGRVDAAEQDYAAAVALYRAAADTAAAARVARALGQLLTRLGRTQEAVQWLEQAISLLAANAVQAR